MCRFLHEYIRQQDTYNDLYGFVNPFVASLNPGKPTIKERGQSLFQAMKGAQPQQMFLVPYNSGYDLSLIHIT